MSDPLMDRLMQLPYATADPDRARRTRARCHRVLDGRERRPRRVRWPGWSAWSRALIGLATMYLAEAVRQGLRAYRAW